MSERDGDLATVGCSQNCCRMNVASEPRVTSKLCSTAEQLALARSFQMRWSDIRVSDRFPSSGLQIQTLETTLGQRR